MGRKPFSAKAKKEQLKERRQRKRGPEASDVVTTVVMGHGHQHHGAAQQVVDMNPQPERAGQQANRFTLRFAKLSRDELEQRKAQSLLPYSQLPGEALEMGLETVYPSAGTLDMPKRPPWSYQMSKDDLAAQENKEFAEFLAKVHAAFPSDQLAHFEHNIETWRQLWRVIEISDVIVLICDVRYAPLHFPPALFDHVLNEKKRHLILILNKCDLVPAPLAHAWAQYFSSKYPGIHVVEFCNFNSNQAVNPWNQHRFRTPLPVADGLDALCDVYSRLGLPGVEQWRQRIAAGRARAEEHAERKQHADQSEYDNPALIARHGRAHSRPLPAAAAARAVDVEVTAQAQTKDEEHGQSGDGEREEDSLYDHPDAEQGELPWRSKGFATIGLVGQPNVGKSTILNSIVGKHVVSTSRTPGHTKYFQTYFLSPELRLCDCPGLVFPAVAPKALQFLAGLVPVSQAQEPFSAIQYLAERINVPRLLRLQLDADTPAWSSRAICEGWALRRGYLTAKAGRPDLYRAAKEILLMAVDGRIALALWPPGWSASPAAVALDAATWAEGVAEEHDGGDLSEEEEESGSDVGDDDEQEDDSHSSEEESDGEAFADPVPIAAAAAAPVSHAAPPCARNAFAALALSGDDED
eukprot:m.77286 g.77286  ORF g.77286 m.77286 type:complete len:637 (+) comp13210_c0_seq3:580-2490(+)